jgi:nitrogen PTS system EIIA component
VWTRQSGWLRRAVRGPREEAPKTARALESLVGRQETSMQLSIRDLTRLLNVAEGTVSRWIKQRGLPAQQVGGQYRIHRAELLEWATANGVRVSLDLFDRLEADEEAVPSLAEALEMGGIRYQLEGADKEGILRALVQALPLPDGMDRELLLRLFLAREASASTAIGEGIAIPHVRNPIVLHVSRPLVTLAFLTAPIDFGALDGKPVHVLFSIISPTNRTHLQLLARLSFALHDGKLRQAVIRHAPREEILQEIRRVELSMEGGVGTGKAEQ